jgi:hypothetical protein
MEEESLGGLVSLPITTYLDTERQPMWKHRWLLCPRFRWEKASGWRGGETKTRASPIGQLTEPPRNAISPSKQGTGHQLTRKECFLASREENRECQIRPSSARFLPFINVGVGSRQS